MTEYQKKYAVQYFNCSCGGRYDTYNSTKHNNTNKHKTYLMLIEKIKILEIENNQLKNQIFYNLK